MLRRLMMATRSRNVPRNSRGETRVKGLGEKKDAAPSREGISSAPNLNSTGGHNRVRAQSTQPPPRLANTRLASLGQGSRKPTSSGSASSVNKNRNILRAGGGTASESGLNKSFKKLSIDNKQSTKSAPSRRQQSTSAGNSSSCKSIEDIARRILAKKSKNVVVMAGAGISTPSGIPDFRTPGSGLYDNLKQYHIPYPEAIFDIGFFRHNPKPFFTLAKELYPSGKYRPNYVHYFVRMLYDKGLLLRMYTQNIDGLERLAGIPGDKLVEAHGTFTSCTCTKCGFEHNGESVKDVIFADKIPRCQRPTCTGVVKPNIVFFGEDLPKRFFYYMKDMPLCDLLIIMGTSLEVYPFAGIVDSVRPFIPRLLINREAVGPFSRPSSSRHNDLAVTGDLVECVQKFARVLGWKKALEDLIQENEARLDETFRKEEERQQHQVEEQSQSTNNNNDQTVGSGSQTSPLRLTPLQREQDLKNRRSLHTDSLSRANSAVRSPMGPPGTANKHRSNSSGAVRVNGSLPRINNVTRSALYRTRRRVVSSSDSSESTSSESSDDTDDD